MKKALLIVAQNGFQPIEYSDTREVLEDNNISVEVGSLEATEATDSQGGMIGVDVSIKEVDIDNYDAIVFIGGGGASKDLIGNSDIDTLVKEADNAQKVIGAICIAPVILAQAGILRDRKGTVWNQDGKQEAELRCQGCEYVNQDVVVDTRIVTANGPAAASAFGKALADLINKSKGDKTIY